MTDHTPYGCVAPVTAYQSPETHEIYRLIMDVRIKTHGVISYLSAIENGVFAPHPLRAELHETAEDIKTICALCLQTKNADALRDLYDYGGAWVKLAEYDKARGLNFSATAEVITAMGEAWRIKNELRADALRTPKPDQTATDKLPLTSNKIPTAEAATALLSELITRGYIAQVNGAQAHGAQVETWLYLWNFAIRPEQITPLNWVENRGLLGVMMGEIAHRGKIHEAAAWAFVGKGKPIKPRVLNSAKGTAKNEPSRRGDARRVELEYLIKMYTNG